MTHGLLVVMSLQSSADRKQADYLAVELDGYQPKLLFGIGKKQTSVNIAQQMTQGDWYQIEVSRFVCMCLFHICCSSSFFSVRLGTTAKISMRSIEDNSPPDTYNQTVTLDTNEVLLNVGSSGRVLVGGVPADYLVLLTTR